jgi:integrase
MAEPCADVRGKSTREESERDRDRLQIAMPIITVSTGAPFKEACFGWLKEREFHISEKTRHEYHLNINTLSKFFGDFTLAEISPDMLRAYQKARLTKCGPFAINHELGVLQQVLKRIGRWDEFQYQYEPLPLPRRKRGRCIEDQERRQLWAIMRSRHDWDGLRLFLTIMINSSAAPSETMRLKLENINAKHRYFEVGRNGAKNDDRVRNIPFNEESEDAFREAIGRAKCLGAFEPWHYLFPRRITGNRYDPMKHQVTFRTAWEKVKQEAVRQGMNVHRLRIEDMRHSAATMLWENPRVSEQTAQDIVGHGSAQMKKFYSHIRVDAQREAIDALAPSAKPVEKAHAESSLDNKALAQQLLALAAKLLSQG